MAGDKVPDCLCQNAARMFLETYHGGTWRMILALIAYALKRFWAMHCWSKWNWIRVKVFRRPQNKALAEFERAADEMNAVEEMAAQL